MLEYKIRGFATLGASLTVIIAFVTNYVISCVLEIFMNHNWINYKQAFGFILVIIGVGFLQHAEEKENSKKRKISAEEEQGVEVTTVGEADNSETKNKNLLDDGASEPKTKKRVTPIKKDSADLLNDNITSSTVTSPQSALKNVNVKTGAKIGGELVLNSSQEMSPKQIKNIKRGLQPTKILRQFLP